MPARFGSAAGELFWHVESSSFGVRLGFVAGRQSRSSADLDLDAVLDLGGTPGRFITVDAVVNQLWLLGLVPDRETVDAICVFRDRVSRTFGDVELAGLATPSGRRLLIVGPDGRTVAIDPPLGGRSHGFHWGGGHPIGDTADPADPVSGPVRSFPAVDDRTMNTARALIASSRGPVWGPTEELAAQALAHNHLSRCGPRFSFTANSLCDWLLFDREPTGGLTHQALLSLSLRVVDCGATAVLRTSGTGTAPASRPRQPK